MAWSREQKWALVRILFGMAQIFGASFSVGLLLQTGVSVVSLVAVAATALFTAVSVLLFGSKKPSQRR